MSGIIIGIFTGALGVGYMLYGRRQARYAPFLAGLALCAYPYFFSNWIWLCVIGAALAVVPFVFDF